MPKRASPFKKFARRAKPRAALKNEATKAIYESEKFRNDPNAFEAAKEYLRKELQLSEDQDDISQHLLEHLYERRISEPLVRVSHEKYLNALELIRAGVAMIMAAPEPVKLIDLVVQRSGAKQRKNADLIGLVARQIINYGYDEKGKIDAVSRRLWSRDAKAIRFLDSKHVPIGGLVKYQREHGGGVDWWSRQWSALAKAQAQAGTEAEEPKLTSDDDSTSVQSMPEVAAELLRSLAVGEHAVVLVMKKNSSLLEVGPYAKVGQKLKIPATESPMWKAVVTLATKKNLRRIADGRKLGGAHNAQSKKAAAT